MKILTQIENSVSVICFAVLAVIFQQWWISLFGLVIPLCSNDKENKDVHSGK